MRKDNASRSGRRRAADRDVRRPAAPASDAPPGARLLIAAALASLTILTLVVYRPVARFSFVNWDDNEYVFANRQVQQGLSIAGVQYAFTTWVAGNWHPLTVLSHMLDVQIFGLDAGAHHLANVAIHLGTTLLLFGVVYAMTRAAGRSWFVAAVFAVHPLHVESVAWISERKDVLSTLLVVIALGAYALYVKRPAPLRYAAAFAAFVLALLAKPMVVTFPVVLLLVDVWPLRRLSWPPAGTPAWRRVVAEKVPFVLAAAAVAAVTLAAQGGAGAVAAFDALPWSQRIANAIFAYGFYLGRTFWPVDLTAFYPIRPQSATLLVGISAALLALTAAAIGWRRRLPFLFVGWIWFVATIAPVSGLIQTGSQAAADRYMYFPLVGLSLAIAWTAADVSDRLRLDRRVPGVVAAAAVVALAMLARQQVGTWKDSLTLWRHAVAVTPSSIRAHEKLAEAERDAGELESAYRTYQRGLSLADGSPRLIAIMENGLGIVRIRQRRTDEALEHFARSVASDPAFSEAQGNLGAALATAGRLDEAERHYGAALALTPDSAEVLVGIAGIRLARGRAAEALDYYAKAAGVDPRMADAYAGIGAAAAALGRNPDAYAAFEKALALEPNLASTRVRLANLLVQDRRVDEAIREIQRALAIDPAQPSWQYGLGVLLVGEGRRDEARRAFEAALAMKPDFAAARDALAGIRD